MDRSREYDLRAFEKKKGRAKNTREREKYDRGMKKIYDQAKNKGLAGDRARLIKAHQNRDVEAADKITEEIKRKYG